MGVHAWSPGAGAWSSVDRAWGWDVVGEEHAEAVVWAWDVAAQEWKATLRPTVTRSLSETLTVSKTTAAVDTQEVQRDKSASLLEDFDLTTTVRPTITRAVSETLTASKTTGKTDTLDTPTITSASLDFGACPDVTFDLVIDPQGDTTRDIKVERKDNGTWSTVTSTLAPGSTSYRDSAATADTEAYRVSFTTGTASDTETVVANCPE